jgi:hypothetical protein
MHLSTTSDGGSAASEAQRLCTPLASSQYAVTDVATSYTVDGCEQTPAVVVDATSIFVPTFTARRSTYRIPAEYAPLFPRAPSSRRLSAALRAMRLPRQCICRGAG